MTTRRIHSKVNTNAKHPEAVLDPDRESNRMLTVASYECGLLVPGKENWQELQFEVGIHPRPQLATLYYKWVTTKRWKLFSEKKNKEVYSAALRGRVHGDIWGRRRNHLPTPLDNVSQLNLCVQHCAHDESISNAPFQLVRAKLVKNHSSLRQGFFFFWKFGWDYVPCTRIFFSIFPRVFCEAHWYWASSFASKFKIVKRSTRS